MKTDKLMKSAVVGLVMAMVLTVWPNVSPTKATTYQNYDSAGQPTESDDAQIIAQVPSLSTQTSDTYLMSNHQYMVRRIWGTD